MELVLIRLMFYGFGCTLIPLFVSITVLARFFIRYILKDSEYNILDTIYGLVHIVN